MCVGPCVCVGSCVCVDVCAKIVCVWVHVYVMIMYLGLVTKCTILSNASIVIFTVAQTRHFIKHLLHDFTKLCYM